MNRSDSRRHSAGSGPRSRILPAIAALLLVAGWAAPIGAAAAIQETGQATLSAEEQLAQKFAPITYLKRQDFECDPGGEPYLPAPVDLTFGDQTVVLRRAPERQEVKRDIDAADLFDGDPALYIDLPGNPREPGCRYERHARERMGDQPPVVYAHVATEEGKDGLALQYWFYYYFNDFNDKHESDWEMIQLLFAADTVEEALRQEPVSIAFSQHAGGETAPWTAAKLRKEEGRPVNFPSRGSHGNYYAPGIWLGWGENRSGVGCDNTTGPSFRVEPEVRLVPHEIAAASDRFAWATFGGNWGERESWVYDGPLGPNRHRQWTQPITWHEELRDSSLKLNEEDTIGVSPTGVFCTLVRVASDILTLSKVHPWAIGAALTAFLVLAVWLVRVARPVLRAAGRVYFPHLGTFVAIGAVLIPVGVAANVLHLLIVNRTPVKTAIEVTERTPLVPALVGLTLGNFQHIAMLVLVGPAVIQAVVDIRAGRRPSVGRAYRVVLDHLGSLVGAGLRALVIILLLTLTVLGIPWAVARTVRWAFFGQAIILDGADGRTALTTSARAVAGHWWRVLAVGAVLVFLGAVLAPLIGIPVMILTGAPLDFVNALGSLLYAFTHPFAVVGGTLLYQELQGRALPVATDPAAAPVAMPAPEVGSGG